MSKRILSALLAIVMLAGLLPTAVISVLAEETAYTKLGEITQVYANAKINPTVGRKNTVFEGLEITTPVDQGVGIATSYWQKWNEASQKWEQYGPVPHPVMEEGTYRIFVQLRSESNDEKEYYALTSNTSLYVNNVMWTMNPDSKVLSYTDGYGFVWFYSPAFVLSKESAHTGGNLVKIDVQTPPDKTKYAEGEYFDTSGMEVLAYYDNSATVPVQNYLVTNCLSLQESQTSVTISYTEDTKTVTTEVPITVVSEWENEMVFEVYSWDDFKAAFYYSNHKGETYTIKLMKSLTYNAEDAKRSANALVEVQVLGCNVTLDFNGYTLKGIDKVSTTDLTSSLSDFIRIGLRSQYGTPIEFRLTDSRGGGGIVMESDRAYDNQLAALHVVDLRCYVIHGIYQTCDAVNKLIIDGGNYELSATTQKIGVGTINQNTYYRGTVIADTFGQGNIVINGGKFVAKSDGKYYNGSDFCARELSAFATSSNFYDGSCGVVDDHTIINGGVFISDGYAIHHFDHSLATDETRSMRFPKIYGGVFVGSVGYIGMSFTYENYGSSEFGMEEFKERPASTIVNPSAMFFYIKGDKLLKQTDDLTVYDLHEADSIYVINESLLKFKTLPVASGVNELERYAEQTETFKVDYTVPYGLEEFSYTPYITVTPNGGVATTENIAEKTIHYKDYPNGLTVTAGLIVNVPAANEDHDFKNRYSIAVSDLPSPPEILAQPYSMTVAPGECAEAMVVVNHAESYQWYYLYDGNTPIQLTDSMVSALGGGIAGYLDAILSVKLNGVGREYFYCVVTGTDGSTVKTDRISFTFGASPSVIGADGGEFYDGQSAKFNLWANYADEVEWVVMKRVSGSTKFYSLEEFAAETGCQYGTAHRSYTTGVHNASVLFQNVPASWANKYSVGYTLKNSLGTLYFNPDTAIPFTLTVVRPQITSLLETVPDEAGEEFIFTFEAENMTDAEWTFEKPDDEGIIIAYTLDEMKAAFPETSFVTALLGNTATLTVSNAALELGEYLVCANAVGTSARTFAGSASFRMTAGLTVSGTVASFGSETDYITVQLYAEGSASAAHTVAVLGNSAYYYFADVEPGNYTLKANKDGHQTYEQAITVGDQPVMIDIVLRKALTITKQPKTSYTANGATAKATVVAEGDGLTYQWYVKNAGGSSYSKSSCKTATYSCKMSSSSKDRYVRCKITDQYGTVVWTNTVRLRMKAGIAVQPANQNVKEGVTAKFTVSAVGSGLKYQWQYRTSSTGSWKNASAAGNTTAELSVPATMSRNGYQYRCRVKDNGGNTIYTNAVRLYVLGIKTQPTTQKVKTGTTATFTVSATGAGKTYQWQYKTSKSGSWQNCTAKGNKTAALKVSATTGKSGYYYRCIIKDSAGNSVTTNTVRLYVLGITTQPAAKTAKAGTTVKFTVAATGAGKTYQWQYKTPNGTWKNITATGAKTATLSVSVTAAKNGYQYRCIVKDNAGNSVTSNAAKLTVSNA